MSRFEEQQEQMQSLKNEITDLKRSQENIAEFVSMEPSESDSQYDPRNNISKVGFQEDSRKQNIHSNLQARNEKLKSFANAVKTLVKHTNDAKSPSAYNNEIEKKKVLDEARKELHKV